MFGSLKVKLDEKSNAFASIVDAGVTLPFSELNTKSDLNSVLLVSTVELASGSLVLIKLVPLKLSTKNPDLNLLRPSTSWICSVFVLSSNRVREVNSSTF